MTCTCQKLQGVIYRTKDRSSFYLKNDTCPEHGGVQGTKIAYVIFDEATGAQLGKPEVAEGAPSRSAAPEPPCNCSPELASLPCPRHGKNRYCATEASAAPPLTDVLKKAKDEIDSWPQWRRGQEPVLATRPLLEPGENAVYDELRQIYCCKGAEFSRPTLEKAWKEIARLTRASAAPPSPRMQALNELAQAEMAEGIYDAGSPMSGSPKSGEAPDTARGRTMLVTSPASSGAAPPSEPVATCPHLNSDRMQETAREIHFCRIHGIKMCAACWNRHELLHIRDGQAAPPSEREAFEKSIYFVGYDFARDDKGDYTDPDTYHAYLGYIARAARVVASQPMKMRENNASCAVELLKVLAEIVEMAPVYHIIGLNCRWKSNCTCLKCDAYRAIQRATITMQNPAPATAPLERSAKYFFYETPWMCDNTVGQIWLPEANNQVFKFAEEFMAWAVDEDIVLSYGKAPCGHSGRYCYTEDGGKHIVCLICYYKSATTSLASMPTRGASK